ncbi:hypothetical protein BDP27DRAFT_1367613 [Rhodocollybia butyracea]|uniref:Uncharacterized protein n=1 Tax=Rhodocollybia butyracea TaxID=206335 RepID=A0A9P5U2Z5_9AGAR|nr:hypothetical protein BDP27DRAFT_1367613 [Rhodocollybia butyracea]
MSTERVRQYIGPKVWPIKALEMYIGRNKIENGVSEPPEVMETIGAVRDRERRMFLGIWCTRDKELGTNTMKNFAKCQDPQRPNLHHDLTIIPGFQKQTASKVGLMKRLNRCCHSLCKPAGAVEAMELEDQLQLANDIIHFLDAVGHSSRKIIIDKQREEREQAEKDVGAKIAAAVASFVAPRIYAGSLLSLLRQPIE